MRDAAVLYDRIAHHAARGRGEHDGAEWVGRARLIDSEADDVDARHADVAGVPKRDRGGEVCEGARDPVEHARASVAIERGPVHARDVEERDLTFRAGEGPDRGAAVDRDRLAHQHGVRQSVDRPTRQRDDATGSGCSKRRSKRRDAVLLASGISPVRVNCDARPLTNRRRAPSHGGRSGGVPQCLDKRVGGARRRRDPVRVIHLQRPLLWPF